MGPSNDCRQMRANLELPQHFFFKKHSKQFHQAFGLLPVLRNKNPVFPHRADKREKNANLRQGMKILISSSWIPDGTCQDLAMLRALLLPSGGAGQRLSWQSLKRRNPIQIWASIRSKRNGNLIYVIFYVIFLKEWQCLLQWCSG